MCLSFPEGSTLGGHWRTESNWDVARSAGWSARGLLRGETPKERSASEGLILVGWGPVSKIVVAEKETFLRLQMPKELGIQDGWQVHSQDIYLKFREFENLGQLLGNPILTVLLFDFS